jgi:hypothetical protein
MPRISPIIESIVATIPDGVYLRATSQEANIELDDIDLEGKIAVLYNNLPDVENPISMSGHVISQWPVEIQILKLADFDDNDVDGDILRLECLRIAEYIIDVFPRNATQVIDSYGTEFLDQVKVYDKTMTGCLLTFIYPIDRTDYCTDLNTP